MGTRYFAELCQKGFEKRYPDDLGRSIGNGSDTRWR